jgi:HEAT repeat protein
LEALKDPDPKVRSAAAEALGFFPNHSDDVKKALIAVLNDPDVSPRRAAVLALGRVGERDHSVEELVKKYLDDPDKQTQMNATIAMALLGTWDEKEIPTLGEALGNKNESTAKGASKALSMIGEQNPEKVIPVLVEALDSKTPVAAVHALPALKKLKKQAGPALPKIIAMYEKSDEDTRSDILDAVSAIDESGDFAVPICLKALREDNPLDRREALIALMRFRSKAPTFFDSLVEELKDKDVENRLLALGLIRGLGPDLGKAAPEIIQLLTDPDMRVRNSAISTLGSIKSPRAEVIEALQKALNDRDYRTRVAAVNALRVIGKSEPERVTPILEQALGAESYDPVKRLETAALEELKNTSVATKP